MQAAEVDSQDNDSWLGTTHRAGYKLVSFAIARPFFCQSSLPIQAAATSPPAQLRTYFSLPIQQGHPATQLSTPENLEHAVITSSPEQLPCSTPFSSQQPPFTAQALPAADSNCLLQQTFITNQVLLTVLTKGPNYNADDTNGNGIEQYLGGG